MASNSQMGDRPVPKMASQGNAKAGGATVSRMTSIRASNTMGKGAGGKLAHKSIKAPGSGSRGQSGNRAGNSVPRAS